MKRVPSLGVPRIVGYSLLLMTLVNWADILLPPRFLDATWELETAGTIVESTPLLFFALVLIFYGEGQNRKKLEQLLVRILSQACLFVSICFFLLIPMTANSTIRVSQDIDRQIGDTFGIQMEQIDQLEDQLEEASNQEIVAILESQGLEELGPDQSITPKDQLLEYLAETRREIQEETNGTKRRRKRSIFKNALKWSLGAVIASLTAVYIWILSRWARETRPKLVRKKG